MISIQNVSIAQWTPLNSTTTNSLHDVDFLTANYGVIVGNSGTILLSQDGGMTWNDINHAAILDDVHSVTVVNFDTIIVSTIHSISNNIGSVFKTTNGGISWINIQTDNGINHDIDLYFLPPSKTFSLGSNLYSTPNLGITWDTLVNYTSSTTIINQLKFANNNVGHASGLVSGIVTYSAYFFRTEDAGQHWFAGDVFSFPNSDAFTSMCFVDPDTAFVFMNRFSPWSPSNINSLIKIYGFNKSSAFPGDTLFTFTNSIINSTMPAFMNDAYFINSNKGFSLGNDGVIYSTIDGGVNWSTWNNINFNILQHLDFVGNTGYAVGDNGSLVKYFDITGIPPINNEISFSLYPNPTINNLNINLLNSNSLQSKLRLFNSFGQIVQEESLNTTINRIDLSNLRSGIYEVELLGKDNAYSKKQKVIKY